MSDRPPDLHVARDGKVRTGISDRGWVDRYEPGKRSSSTWRWVKPGGATSPRRFRTRAEAVDDLLGLNS